VLISRFSLLNVLRGVEILSRVSIEEAFHLPKCTATVHCVFCQGLATPFPNFAGMDASVRRRGLVTSTRSASQSRTTTSRPQPRLGQRLERFRYRSAPRLRLNFCAVWVLVSKSLLPIMTANLAAVPPILGPKPDISLGNSRSKLANLTTKQQTPFRCVFLDRLLRSL
jgi:hypothetical protein